MSEKQIIINYKNICENYSKEVGCYNTFDGSCIKEQCFTYRLLQLLKAKEQECEELKEKLLRKRAVVEFADCPYYSYGDNTIEPTCTKNFCYDVKSCDYKNMVKYKQTLAKIKEIADKDFKHTAWEEYAKQLKQILQKISEVENEM